MLVPTSASASADLHPGLSFPLRLGDYDFEGPSLLSETMIPQPHINPNLRKKINMVLPVLWPGRPDGLLGLPRAPYRKNQTHWKYCVKPVVMSFMFQEMKNVEKRRCGRQKNVHPPPQDFHFLIPAICDRQLTQNGMLGSNEVKDLGRRS